MLSILKKSSNKIFFVLFFIIFCFCFKIYNVSALVYKDGFYSSYNNTSNTSGSLTSNQTKTASWGLNNYVFSTDYDYLVFKFGSFEVSYREDTTGSYCFKWSPSGSSYECTMYQNTQGTSTTFFSNIYITGSLHYLKDNTDYYVPCYKNSDMEDLWVCPLNKNYGNPDTFLIEIKNYRNISNVNYNFSLNGFKYYYNNDTTEMTIQQNQTNTNLQYIYTQQQQQNQYMTQTENGSTTDYQNGVSSLTQSINSQIQSVNDLTQIVLMPITLFMNLSTDTCTPLHLQVPFVNYSFDLPCMKAIYTQYFGGFYAIFASILSAITCYWISIRSASLIKDILDCDNDRIEVVDL